MNFKHASAYLLVVLALVLSGAAAQAATYWVHPSGSNTNPCTNSASPLTTGAKRTVAAGLACLSGGDTLYIRSTGATVYQEDIQGSQIPAGSSGAPTIIAGYQAENPTLRCNPCSNNLNGISVVIGGSYITLQGFTIDNINGPNNSSCINTGAAQFITISGMTCLNAARNAIQIHGDNVTVRQSLIKDCGRIQPPDATDAKGLGVYSGNSNTLVEYNIFDGCRGGAATISQSASAINDVIRYNLVRNTGPYSPWGSSGILSWNAPLIVGLSQNASVYGNIVYNAFGCVLAWGGASNVSVYNNTCHNLDSYGIAYVQGSSGIVKNNILSVVPSARAIVDEGYVTQSNNLVNPTVSTTFVDAGAGNFKLISGSPPIDKGANLSAPYDRDFNGLQRPQGCCYDIGAYEYVVSGASPLPPTNLQVTH